MTARLAVHVVGPLQPYRDGFAEAMRWEGYAEGPVELHSHLLAHLSRWLLERGLGASDLTPPVLEEFFAGRRTHRRWLATARAAQPLLRYLRAVGAVPAEVQRPPVTAADELVGAFGNWLVCDRGLAAASVELYVRWARHLTARWWQGGGVVPGNLDPAAIIALVRDEVDRLAAPSAQHAQRAAFLPPFPVCHRPDEPAAGCCGAGRGGVARAAAPQSGAWPGRRGSARKLRPDDAGRPSRPGGAAPPPAPRPAGRRGRRARARLDRLACWRDRRRGKATPARAAPPPGRRRRGDRRLSVRWTSPGHRTGGVPPGEGASRSALALWRTRGRLQRLRSLRRAPLRPAPAQAHPLCAMTLLDAGNDVAVIGLFLGHEKLESTQSTATWLSKSAPSAAPQRCAVTGNADTAHPTRCLPSSRPSDYAASISSFSSSNSRDARHAA
jgi:hypothetical protein